MLLEMSLILAYDDTTDQWSLTCLLFWGETQVSQKRWDVGTGSEWLNIAAVHRLAESARFFEYDVEEKPAPQKDEVGQERLF